MLTKLNCDRGGYSTTPEEATTAYDMIKESQKRHDRTHRESLVALTCGGEHWRQVRIT